MGDAVFRVNHKLGVVEIVLDGDISLVEVREALDYLASVRELPRDFNLLVTLTPTSSLSSLTLADFERHRALTAEWNAKFRTGPQPRTAIFCPDKIKQSMINLWKLLNNHQGDGRIEIENFVTREEALAWLIETTGPSQAPADPLLEEVETELELEDA